MSTGHEVDQERSMMIKMEERDGGLTKAAGMVEAIPIPLSLTCAGLLGETNPSFFPQEQPHIVLTPIKIPIIIHITIISTLHL